MECSEDRGIESNGLCFNYVDGNVTLTVFKNLPGVARELAGTIFQRAFSPQEWEEINRFLIKTLDKVEGVFNDVEEDDGVIEIDSEGNVHPPEASKVLSEISQLREEAKEAESSPLFQQVVPETSKANGIPKMSNAEAILPENKVPAMTKEEMKENGKEV